MTRTFKKLLALTMLGTTTLFGLGCKRAPIDSPTCGGTVDQTDYDAPKTIESKEIASFEATFFFREDDASTPGRRYHFTIEPDENGTLIAAEDTLGVLGRVDASVMESLQGIVDEEKFAELNGVHKYVSGLPPEFQPCGITARYASGATLSFVVNGDPDHTWPAKIYSLLVAPSQETPTDAPDPR